MSSLIASALINEKYIKVYISFSTPDHLSYAYD